VRKTEGGRKGSKREKEREEVALTCGVHRSATRVQIRSWRAGWDECWTGRRCLGRSGDPSKEA
jgi:hypothetical protein